MTDQKNKATAIAKDAPVDDEETRVADTAKLSTDTAAPVTTSSASLADAPTLREVFSVPQKLSDPTDDRWQAFQDKLTREAKGIKWTAAMPDLGAKICELLDIKIHDILMTAWKKAEAMGKVMEDSRADPERSIYLDLVEHSIDYETKPFVDVKLKAASIKKITLTVALNFKLKGFTLKVQNGLIREIQTGSCEAKGAIKYEKLLIAEKKLSPIKLPLTIKVPNLLPASEPAAKEREAPPSSATSEAPKAENEKPAEPIERIEL